MTIDIIDPHLHLFDRSRGDYHWLKSENPPFWPDKAIIQHDFAITDIHDQLSKGCEQGDDIKLFGFVHIEAGFDNDKPWRELEYIENLRHNNVRTIANIDLLSSSTDFKVTLDKIKAHSSLIGVRHMLDENAYLILSNQQAQHNFACLNEITDFIFELQLSLVQENINEVMPLLVKTITKNNQLRFIINHAGFPPESLSDEAWCLWQKNIAVLAQHTNVFIKCSGMEMISRHYTMSWFSQVTTYCIKHFSIERVMIASNFPLCLLGNKLGNKLGKKPGKNLSKKSYACYWQDILESAVIKQCHKNEKSALLYHNALGIYQLKGR